MRRSTRSMVVVCILAVLPVCAARAELVINGTFDWRDIDGKDYTTPVRDQGSAGTCWAFATMSAFESKLEISAGDPDWNPDMSEQHLVSDPNGGGDIGGGWPVQSLQFLVDTGVVTEAELPYAGEDIPAGWPLAAGWEDRTYQITSYNPSPGVTTGGLKIMLQLYGPLITNIDMYNDLWFPGEAEPEIPAINTINHSVAVIGFVDDPSLTAGGYWIIKNSWGTDWGDDGYGYSLYGFFERHGYFRAIDGAAYPVPEPATLTLLAIGGLVTLRRRRAA